MAAKPSIDMQVSVPERRMTTDGEPMRDGKLAASQYDVSPEMVRLATDRLGDRARILNADLAEPLGRPAV